MPVEAIVMEYLRGALSLPCVGEIPEDFPEGAPFLLVERTGGSEDNCVGRATLAIQSYGGSLLAAAELNERVKSAMRGIGTLPRMGGARLNSDYNYSDPDSRRYRYQAVYNVTYQLEDA